MTALAIILVVTVAIIAYFIGRIVARNSLRMEFEQWKAATIQAERDDAIKRSRFVNRGLVVEQIAPHLTEFRYSPKDAHFIGKPFDYVIFDGLDEGQLREIVFMEIKTGKARQSSREMQVEEIVEAGKVRYEILRLNAVAEAVR